MSSEPFGRAEIAAREAVDSDGQLRLLAGELSKLHTREVIEVRDRLWGGVTDKLAATPPSSLRTYDDRNSFEIGWQLEPIDGAAARDLDVGKVAITATYGLDSISTDDQVLTAAELATGARGPLPWWHERLLGVQPNYDRLHAVYDHSELLPRIAVKVAQTLRSARVIEYHPDGRPRLPYRIDIAWDLERTDEIAQWFGTAAGDGEEADEQRQDMRLDLEEESLDPGNFRACYEYFANHYIVPQIGSESKQQLQRVHDLMDNVLMIPVDAAPELTHIPRDTRPL